MPPEEVLQQLSGKISKKASTEYVMCVAEMLPSKTYPDIFFKSIVKKSKKEGKKRLKKIGCRLIALADEKEDKGSADLLQEMKKIVKTFFIGLPSSTMKKTLLYGALETLPTLSLVSFLLKKRVSPEYWIVGCIEKPLEDDFFHYSLRKLKDDFFKEDDSSSIRHYALKNNLRYMSWDQKKKVAQLLAFSERNKRTLMGIHKLMHLNIMPFYGTICNVEEVMVYAMKILRKDARWSLDCNYAKFKCELDGEKNAKENRALKNIIWQFYVRHPEKNNISYIRTHIKDERYCEDLPLFNQMMVENTGFLYERFKIIIVLLQ